MDYESAKDEFISSWGTLGTSWGINRTVAQIFALLLITPGELCVEDIMSELNISRGNTSMNIRILMEWELVSKSIHKGDRKEYFSTDRDVWALARQVARIRRKKEFAPILDVLNRVKNIDADNSAETKEFKRVTTDLAEVVQTTDKVLDLFIASEQSWITSSVIQFLKKGPKNLI